MNAPSRKFAAILASANMRCDFRDGSTTEVSQGRGNVRFRGYSGSRFWAAECLLVAISRLTPVSNGNRIFADRDAGDRIRLQHIKSHRGQIAAAHPIRASVRP